MQPVKIGLLGLGTVGCGTVNVLARNADEITRRAGRGIEVVRAAVRRPDAARACSVAQITTDPYHIVDDPEIAIVVELMGGTTPALALVLRAIANGKHVVTANKALIALHGNEIFKAAQESGVIVAFEAAVGGGVPIIKAIREGLAANRIHWLAGIINGTCNYILTAMRDLGKDFDAALAEAQQLGYAEADPTFDIEGVDAAHKLTILASIAFGIPLQFAKAHVEGISSITALDVRYAEELGYRIKHLGIARRRATGVELRAHPALIPARRLLANVDGVLNAIVVNADAVGTTLYYGRGAGAEPTASAVIADLVDVVRVLTADPEHRVPHLAFQADALADTPILPLGETESAYYLRLQADDKPGVLADVTRILAEADISIEAILQKEPQAGAQQASVVLLTHRIQEQQMQRAQARIEALATIRAPMVRIRLETLD